ncbi:MAG: hypothetical protein E6J90_21930 [Deltaproteobacteria bacterium]|nr:MAG: hypothetical protein E6J91_32380 [Deltaproteobacteria bacterium]TMQ17685.1 MAG: hypothetical protein E6J90_21930 [Deltaproteobacteria bacterium]
MKKSTTGKLALRTQTIRLLTSETLGRVAGGDVESGANGFIMKDSVIVRTGIIATAPIEAGR